MGYQIYFALNLIEGDRNNNFFFQLVGYNYWPKGMSIDANSLVQLMLKA